MCRLRPGLERHSSLLVASDALLARREGEVPHAPLGLPFVAAFLQGKLLENKVVYCSMPSSYATGLDASNPSGTDTVLRIEKSPSTAWRRRGGADSALTLFPYLLSHGFVATECDPCVFTRRETVQAPSGPRDETLIIGCYTSTTCSPSTRTTTSTRSIPLLHRAAGHRLEGRGRGPHRRFPQH